MKRNRLIIVLLSLIITSTAQSQFTKGDRLIGGAVNVYSSTSAYAYQNIPTTNNNNFGSGLVPRFSWVGKNNVTNGIFLNANYAHSNSSTSSNSSDYSKYDSYSFGLGYFVRKYNDFNQQFGWFLEYNGVVSYGGTKQTQAVVSGASNYKSSSLSAGLNVSPGLYYKASQSVVIEAGFGGANATYSKGTGQNSESHGFNVGLNFPSNFTFGLQFLLPGKQSDKS